VVGDIVYITLSASLGYLIKSFFKDPQAGQGNSWHGIEGGVVMLSNVCLQFLLPKALFYYLFFMFFFCFLGYIQFIYLPIQCCINCDGCE
jgi:hypothetical protein